MKIVEVLRIFTFSLIEWLQVCGFFMLSVLFGCGILIGAAMMFSNTNLPMKQIWIGLGVLIAAASCAVLIAHLLSGIRWISARLRIGRLQLRAYPTAAKPGEVIALELYARDIDLADRRVSFKIAFERYVDESPNSEIDSNEVLISSAPAGKVLRADVCVPNKADANDTNCVCIAYATVNNRFEVRAQTEIKLLLADGQTAGPGIWKMLKEMMR